MKVFFLILAVGLFSTLSEGKAPSQIRIGCTYRVNSLVTKVPRVLSFDPYKDGGKTLVESGDLNITVAYSRSKSGVTMITISAVGDKKTISSSGTIQIARLSYNEPQGDYVQVQCGQQ